MAMVAKKVADQLGQQEDSWIGRDKKKQQPPPAKQPEKKFTPPPGGGAQRPNQPAKQAEPPKPKPAPARSEPAGKTQASRLDFAQLFGAGAKQTNAIPVGGGGNDGKKEESSGGPSGAALDGAAARTHQTADRSDRDSHDDGEEAKRFWWDLGR